MNFVGYYFYTKEDAVLLIRLYDTEGYTRKNFLDFIAQFQNSQITNNIYAVHMPANRFNDMRSVFADEARVDVSAYNLQPQADGRLNEIDLDVPILQITQDTLCLYNGNCIPDTSLERFESVSNNDSGRNNMKRILSKCEFYLTINKNNKLNVLLSTRK